MCAISVGALRADNNFGSAFGGAFFGTTLSNMMTTPRQQKTVIIERDRPYQRAKTKRHIKAELAQLEARRQELLDQLDD